MDTSSEPFDGGIPSTAAGRPVFDPLRRGIFRVFDGDAPDTSPPMTCRDLLLAP